MNDKSIQKNIGVSMLAKLISMFLSLIYTPIALAFLGETKYGVWAIILNIISWINYFDIGIGNGLRNKLAESHTNHDENTSQVYVSTAYLATSVISLAFCILIISFWNILNLSEFFNLNVDYDSTDIVIAISIVFVCINFVLSLSRTIMYAIQKPGIISVIGVVGQMLQIGVLLILSNWMNENLTAVAIMYGSVSLIDNIILKLLIGWKYPYLNPSLKKIQLHYLKPIMTLGVGFFIMQISTLVLNTTDNLLISNLFGVAEVTPYNMVYKVFYMFVQAHAIIIMPMWSAYTMAATKNDIVWIRKTIKKVNIVTMLLAVGVLVGIFLFEAFAAIWLGERLDYGSNIIWIVAVYMIAQMIGNNYSAFLCGVGEIRIPTLLAAIGAIVNIPLSIFFAKTCGMGLPGIILGSLTVMMMSVIAFPVITHKWLRCKGGL